MNIYKEMKAVAEEWGKEIAEQIYAAARYEVQEDFNEELVPHVASLTGHENLANTVFVEVSLDSTNDLDVNKYTEEAYVAGLFKSRSSYHPGYEGWKEVAKFKGMTREEFWDMRLSGADEDHGTYGGVQSAWVTDNFWRGKVWVTNGWPRSDAETLHAFEIDERVSGEQAVDSYIYKYIADGRYPKHILKAMKKIVR